MINSTTKQLFLFHEKNPSIKQKLHDIDKEQFTWIYFGQNVLRCQEIEANDLLGIPKFNISDELQQTAKDFRQKYIDYVGELIPKTDQFFWWLTSVSEKNFHVSSLFLYLCYLDIAIKYTEKTSKNLIIISESRALLSVIETNLKTKSNVNIIFVREPYSQKLNAIQENILFLVRIFYFVVRWICRYFLSRLFGILRGRKNERYEEERKTILHSWVDKRSLAKGEDYQEIYLGSLGTDLKQRHQPIIYLIDVLPTVFFPSALLNLIYKKDDLYIMEEFLPFMEIFRAVIECYVKYPILEKIPKFGTYNIETIVIDELISDRKNTRAAQAYFCYIIGKQLSKKFGMRMFIYSFENLMWEKMFCLALSESSPSTKKIAYQHVLPCPMYTFYSVSEFEKKAIPLPDLILTNGVKGKNSLNESGFSALKIIVIGHLRFKSLSKKRTERKKEKTVAVLIPTSASINESVEILCKSIMAFLDKNNFEVIVKFHPTLPIQKILKSLPMLPSNFSIREDPSDSLLNQIDVVVYSSSSVAAEAVAKGIPAVHVKSDYWIDTNILDGVDFIPSVSTSEKLYKCVYAVNSRGFLTHEESDRVTNDLFASLDYTEFMNNISGNESNI